MEVVAPEILSADEIRDVTGYARAAQQAAWLRERCVPHRLEGRRVILSRHHFREWLEGLDDTGFAWHLTQRQHAAPEA